MDTNKFGYAYRIEPLGGVCADQIDGLRMLYI